MPYISVSSPAPHSRSSSITFSSERGPGAFTPLASLPRRRSSSSTTRKSLFHIHNDVDDDQDQDQDHSPLPSPPLETPRASDAIPFPSSSPLASPALHSPQLPHPSLSRTSSSSTVILSNGRPLKPSLKSASSLALDEQARVRHARAQSEPPTPSLGPKNVHFKDKDSGLESVRLFKRTGRPAAVSSPPNPEDTETETEAEQNAFPFPVIPPSGSPSTTAPIAEIDTESSRNSSVPATEPDPYANVHLESLSLPPARPPVLRGTVLVRNVSFEKHVGVRFTLDEWTTVSEVLGTYVGGVAHREAIAGTTSTSTVGDLVGTLAKGGHDPWDRFTFAIRLEDYEARLPDRTLFLVARYTAPGNGEWWDNNSGENYSVAFRAKAPVVTRKRGASAPLPSASPFLASAAPTPAPQLSPQESRATFSLPERSSPPKSPAQLNPPPSSPAIADRPPPLVRAASTPAASRSMYAPITLNTMLATRLNLKHYAAPARVSPLHSRSPSQHSPSPNSPLMRVIGGQLVTEVSADELQVRSPSMDRQESPTMRSLFGLRFSNRDTTPVDESTGGTGKGEIEDEGFASAGEGEGEDGDVVTTPREAVTPTEDDRQGPASPSSRRFPPLSIQISPPSMASFGSTSPRPSPPSSSSSSPSPSPSPVLFDSAGMNPSDSSYAAFLKQWCFAHSSPPQSAAMGEIGFSGGLSPINGGIGGMGNSINVEAVGMMG